MAIVHTRLKVLSRSTRSTVAALAYRSGTELVDQEIGEVHNYLHKSVAGVELLLPGDAPDSWKELQALIKTDKHEGVQKLSNIAEAHEKRKDAQVYREYEFALPRELTDDENKTLAREFVQDQICGLGMAAKLNFHFDVDEEGNRFPHVHVVMLTRRLEQDGLSRLKERGWNRKELAKEWRFQFCEYANFHFKQKGIDITLDPRSYAEQGIALIPQVKIGKNVSEMEARQGKTNRGKEYNEVKLSNQFTIIKNPQVVIDEITSKQTTFTERDIHKVLNRYIDDRDLHQQLVGEIKSLKSVIHLNKGGLYTTKDLIKNEQRFLAKLTDLQTKTGYGVKGSRVAKELKRTNKDLSQQHNSSLSTDQIEALKAMVSKDRLVFIEGYAGSGKTTVVKTAANIWKSSGYNVVGLAPTNKAKEGLKGAGIQAYTVHSFLNSYTNNRQQFNKDTVLVLDEAGMVDLKRYTGLLNAVDRLGVKLVSLGDRGQLAPVEAGCPFTMASRQYEFTKLTSIIRQRKDWQKEATQAFGHQNGLKGLRSYFENGNIKFVEKTDSADKRSSAKGELIQDWISFRQENPDKTSCILAHTNKDVADLNDQVRAHLRSTGDIKGKDFTYVIEHMKEGKFGKTRTVSEERSFAVGDQIVFTGTNKGLGVHNGNIGRITALNRSKVQVEVDNKTVSFSPNLFKNFELGWAMTVNKSQGATFDEGFVLGSRGLYANLTYVALTRHRDNVRLYLSQNEFDDSQKALFWLTRQSDDQILSNIMTPDQVLEGMKQDKAFFKDAYQVTKNTLSAIQYVGSRKLKEWTGLSAENIELEHNQRTINSVPKPVIEASDSQQISEHSALPIEANSQETEDKNTFTSSSKTRSSFAKMDRQEFSRFVEKINESIQGDDLAKGLLRHYGLNSKSSGSNQLRFGELAHLAVNISGHHENTWYDFERSEGGNLLKLIQREQGCDFKASVAYAADYCRGSIRSEIDRFLEGKSIDRTTIEAIPQQDKDHAKEAHLEQQRQKIADVNKLVEKSLPIQGSPAESYLRNERNIQGELPDSLRYVPPKTEFSYNGEDKYVNSGAMISIAKSSEGETRAIQLTYLTEEGTRSKNADGETFAKITYGSSKGAYVTLQEGSGPFIMAEGAETALSLKEAGVNGKIVCSLGIGNYKNIIKDQKNVIIAADWDGSEEMPTYKAAEKAQAQVEAQGGKAQIILPIASIESNEEKTDFNDILKAKGTHAIRDTITKQCPVILDRQEKGKHNDNTVTRDQKETESHQHELAAKNAPQMGKDESVAKTPDQDPQEALKQNILAYFKHELRLEENAGFPAGRILAKASNDPLDTLKWWQAECDGSPFEPLDQSAPGQHEVGPAKDISDLFAEKINKLDEYIDLLSDRKGYESSLAHKESERSDLLNSANDNMLQKLHTKYPDIAERVEQRRVTNHQGEQSRGHDMSI